MFGLSQVTLPAARPDVPAAGPLCGQTGQTSTWATRALLAAWTLIGLGIGARDGEFSAWGLLALVVAFALVLSVAAVGRPLARPDRRELAVVVAVCLAAAVVHPAHRLMHVRGAGLVAVEVMAAATAATVLASLAMRDQRLGWWLGAAMAAATGIVTIAVVPDPHIDVWYLLQQSSTGLLHGQDMYRQHWQHSHGLQAVYPYLPATTVLLAPFRWLATDVRAGLLLASLLTSWQLRRAAALAPAALSLLVLVHPHWTFLVDQSWTEPVLLALLTAAVVAIGTGRPLWAVLALGVALACKQHIVLLLPLFALWPSFGLKRTAQAAGVAVLLVAPWVIWDPHQFWHDAVKANLDLGVIPRALCVPSFLLRHGIEVGFWFPLLALAVAYTVIALRVRRTPSGLALGSALVLLALDLTNKQSFFNHYTLPLGLLVVAMTVTSFEPARRVERNLT